VARGSPPRDQWPADAGRNGSGNGGSSIGGLVRVLAKSHTLNGGCYQSCLRPAVCLPLPLGGVVVVQAGLAVVIAELLAIFGLIWLFSRNQIVITFEKGADVATLALVAATLVVTCVAVVIAVITIWGFREIRDRAVEAAVSKALEAVQSQQKIRQAFEAGQTSPSSGDADLIAATIGEDQPGNVQER
jgi:hypothetical protein